MGSRFLRVFRGELAAGQAGSRGGFGGDDSGVAERGFGREAEHGGQVERVGAGGEGFFEDAVLAQVPKEVVGSSEIRWRPITG